MSGRRIFRGATALVLAVTAFVALPAGTATAQQNRDSVDARRRAVRAQERFEQTRRLNLPRGNSSPPPRGCDAHIGRFCQWNSDDDTTHPRESRAVTRARLALLASLDSAARRSPRDGWITGQRVRYLLENGDDTAAVRVARECAATEWWCAALEGLALQHSGANGAAPDSAFARALRTMPPLERCRWTDVTLILDPPVRKKFGKVGCGRNEALAERLWWVADPFWSLPGNDRRTEHYARHTMARILEPARIAFNLSWANDLREMIVRYGWARYWTRGDGTAFDPYGGPVSGHEPTPSYHFVPVSLGPDSVPSASYDLAMVTSAERYQPVAARHVFEIDPQVAVFMRGDSALVVAAYDVSKHHEFDSANVASALVVARNELTVPAQNMSSGRASAMRVKVEPRAQMLSLEVISAEARAAAWKRSVLNLAPAVKGRLSMSDVLLFDPRDSDVSDIESAMRTALGSVSVPRTKVGLYWEMYGLARTDSAMPVSLTLTRVGKTAVRRIGESIGLAAKSSPLSIRWSQTMSRSSVTARSVILDLSLIPKGKYQLKVEAGPAVTTRTIEVE